MNKIFKICFMQNLQHLGMLFPQSKIRYFFGKIQLCCAHCWDLFISPGAYSNRCISCPGLDLPYYIWESNTHVSFWMQNRVIVWS